MEAPTPRFRFRRAARAAIARPGATASERTAALRAAGRFGTAPARKTPWDASRLRRVTLYAT